MEIKRWNYCRLNHPETDELIIMREIGTDIAHEATTFTKEEELYLLDENKDECPWDKISSKWEWRYV